MVAGPPRCHSRPGPDRAPDHVREGPTPIVPGRGFLEFFDDLHALSGERTGALSTSASVCNLLAFSVHTLDLAFFLTKVCASGTLMIRRRPRAVHH